MEFRERFDPVKKKAPQQEGLCARDRNRTDTSLRMADFESAASTNSATRAGCLMGGNITTFVLIAAPIGGDIFF